MADFVKIKSFPNGISLRLSEEPSFETILEEVGRKFAEGKNFFGKASMALSIEGRAVSEAEEIKILEAIRKNSNVNIVCIVGHDEETDRRFIKALKQIERKLTGKDDALFFKGSLKDKQILEAEGSVVVMGDVNPGCSVFAGEHIIVLGGLYGEAHCGKNEECDAFVIALEMEPERLKIGDFKYKSKEKARWGIRPKVQPKIAYLKDQRVLVEPLTKELLASI